MPPWIDFFLDALRRYLPVQQVLAFLAAVAFGYAVLSQQAYQWSAHERDYFRAEAERLRTEISDSGMIGQADSVLAKISVIEVGLPRDEYAARLDTANVHMRVRRPFARTLAEALLEAYRVMLDRHEQISDILRERRR